MASLKVAEPESRYPIKVPWGPYLTLGARLLVRKLRKEKPTECYACVRAANCCGPEWQAAKFSKKSR